MHEHGGKQHKSATTWVTQPQLPTDRQSEHSGHSILITIIIQVVPIISERTCCFQIYSTSLSADFFITRVVTFSYFVVMGLS